MADVQSEYTLDLSALDPDNITSSSTPRLLKRASMPPDATAHARQEGESQLQEPRRRSPEHREETSAYSIHLSAIDPASASSTLNLDREITRLESEDIGGPSDFTQNLVDWISGSREIKGPAAGSPEHPGTVEATETLARPTAQTHEKPRLYRYPSVEDYVTPAPRRHTSPSANAPNGDASSEEEIVSHITPLASSHQVQDWQSLCTELQKKNDQLVQSMELHRRALAEMKQTQHLAEVEMETEAEDLRRQLTVFDRGSTRPLADSTTLGTQPYLSEPCVASTRALLERAHTALFDQQKRIEELEQRLRDERESKQAQRAEAQKEEDVLDRRLRAAQLRAREADEEVCDMRRRLQEQAAASEQESKSASNSASDREAQLQQQVEALQGQSAEQEKAHQAEIAAIRHEYQEVAADVDTWVVAKVKEKEDRYAASLSRKDKKIAELKARNQELERIYALCGKELMLAWGREEFGAAKAGEKQPYRYHSTVRNV